MKKFLPYLLLFTIVASTLAPFSVGFRDEKLAVQSQIVEAANTDIGNVVMKQFSNTENSIMLEIELEVGSHVFGEMPWKRSVTVFLKKGGAPYGEYKAWEDFQLYATESDKSGFEILSGYLTIEGLDPATHYEAYIHATHSQWLRTTGEVTTSPITVHTVDPNNNKSWMEESFDSSYTEGTISNLPPCGLGGSFTGGSDSSVLGCVAQILYYVIYVPTSWLFAGAGRFFDIIFDYSIKDDSYRSSFVEEGWKIVRDLCNIFFIFILLYVAISLILGLENAKAKEMIVNVIIIGLLINFSLFFAKVVIDSGNILARVFYNSQAIEEQVDVNAQIGGAEVGQNAGKEISLTAGLINKVDPQKIVANARKIKVVDRTSGESSTAGEDSDSNLSVGGYILVVLLASVVNIIGIFVFITVGLIFMARVVGLWFAMIFAPFAFLSYTVPKLSNIKFLGWKNWWGDLISLSFLAPIFMFMLYIIILFVEKGFGDIVKDDNTGLGFILSVIIPFIFIMVMLLMAKKLAKDYSGSLGQAVIKGVNTVAGVAGGVALGAGAIAARQTLGRGASFIGKQEGLNKKAAEGKAWAVGLKKITNVGEKASFDVRKTAVGAGIAKETGVDLDRYSKIVGLGASRTEGGYTGKRERDRKKEEEFGKTLTHDTKKEERIKTDINNTKSSVETEKTNIDNAKVVMASNKKKSTAYKDAARNKALAEQRLRIHEKNLSDQKEALETNKVGRARDYYQYKRKQSGRVVAEPEKRDKYGNITEYAKMGKVSEERVGEQIARGFRNALADGGIAGGATLAFTALAGSVAIGPAVAATLAVGTLSGVRRAVQEYSGTHNRQVGDTASESPRENK